jgi:hypothetical protein
MTDDYPRPDFVRDESRWQSLDGTWSFLFDDSDVGLSDRWHHEGLPEQTTLKPNNTDRIEDTGAPDIVSKIASGTQELLKGNRFGKNESIVNKKREIQVPYVFQCPASGINEQGVHEVLWYERDIVDLRSENERLAGHRVVIRFGAVDYEAKIWVGGNFCGDHRGGHVRSRMARLKRSLCEFSIRPMILISHAGSNTGKRSLKAYFTRLAEVSGRACGWKVCLL